MISREYRRGAVPKIKHGAPEARTRATATLLDQQRAPKVHDSTSRHTNRASLLRFNVPLATTSPLSLPPQPQGTASPLRPSENPWMLPHHDPSPNLVVVAPKTSRQHRDRKASDYAIEAVNPTATKYPSVLLIYSQRRGRECVHVCKRWQQLLYESALESTSST